MGNTPNILNKISADLQKYHHEGDELLVRKFCQRILSDDARRANAPSGFKFATNFDPSREENYRELLRQYRRVVFISDRAYDCDGNLIPRMKACYLKENWDWTTQHGSTILVLYKRKRNRDKRSRRKKHEV